MTTKSREELIIEALDQLGIIVPGQAPSATIMNKVDTLLDPVMEQLAELDIYYVDDAGAIGPSGGSIRSSAFMALGAYLANAAAAKFNLPADAKLKALALEAEQTLRTLTRPSSTRKTLRTDVGIPTGNRSRFNYTTG